jgi:D-alanyl-D-alanine carboxypeptidase
VARNLPVLEPVRRRRRRRRPWWLVPLALAAVAIAAVALTSRRLPHHRHARTHAEPVAKARPTPARRPARRPQPGLHVGRRLRPSPHVSARAAILVDAGTGDVLFARYPHRRLPIASTTKIMTALLVIEHGSLDSIVHVGPTVPRVPLVKEGLRAGERVPVWKLLYSLLLYSGNDDALALAIHTAGSRPEFIRLMNAEAKRLGLRDTHFNSPSGVLDERNYSSAWDLAVLTRRALRNATFARIVRTRVEHVRWAPPTFAKVYVNKNLLLGSYPGAIGVKTGFTTKAGDCLVAAARRHGRTFVAVLLHDVNRYQDARRLLTLAFAGEAATRGTRR